MTRAQASPPAFGGLARVDPPHRLGQLPHRRYHSIRKVAGRAEEILTARDAKLAAARQARNAKRQQQRERIPA